MSRSLPILALFLALAAFGTMLFGQLAHPLLWQDEGETVMFAERVAEYGYPKVHGPRNVVNEFGAHAAAGVKESSDAYIGKTWGDFYWAVPGLLWARGTTDVYERTWRLRLPFAATGALAVAVMLWAVLPAVARGRRLGFAALYFGLCAVSISLVLHLREVRYYALLVLLLGVILGLHVRAVTLRRAAWRPTVWLQALSLFLLFHVFFAAWFPVMVLTGVDAARRAWRQPPDEVGTGGGARWRRVGRALLPHALSALLVAPALLFFETFSQAAGFSRSLGWSPGVVLENLGAVVLHLARYELLLPALAARLAVAVACRGVEPGSARQVASGLLLFAAGYAAAGCLNPLIYERYFVVLGPVLSLAFLLDASTLLERVPRRHLAATVAALVVVVGAALAWRAPEISGRLAELRTPYRGPLDFVVPWVLERHPEPRSLVVATNYEAHPLMYYLGSHVIVGLSLNNIVAERRLTPDVVIPRGRWPRSLVEIRKILRRGGYEAVELPVLDLHYNNIPSVGGFGATPDPHRYRTAEAPEGSGLRIYWRPGPVAGADPEPGFGSGDGR